MSLKNIPEEVDMIVMIDVVKSFQQYGCQKKEGETKIHMPHSIIPVYLVFTILSCPNYMYSQYYPPVLTVCTLSSLYAPTTALTVCHQSSPYAPCPHCVPPVLSVVCTPVLIVSTS